MTKNYYRSEYSDKQWKALIDKATELGCQITYSKYGNIVTIDSTDRESLIIAQTGRGEQDRAVWAGHIHNMLQESTDLRTWKVQPKRYRKGYCPTICKSQKVAEHEQERLERMKLCNPRCDWPRTAKAKVYAESCYISFGIRFGQVKQYLNTGE